MISNTSTLGRRAGAPSLGRPAQVVLCGPHAVGRASALQGRLVIVCMGRNDGASGQRRRSKRRPRSNRDVHNPDLDSGLWEQGGPQPGTGPSTSGRAGHSPAAPSRDYRGEDRGAGNGGSTWERAGSIAGAQGGRRRRDDDDDDTRGWWERPEERSLQSFAAPQLEPWQEQRLQLAAASGRRKAQIQELARELDVDRSVVLGWFKEFALRPQSERDALTGAARAEDTRRQQQQRAAGPAPGQGPEEAGPGPRGGPAGPQPPQPEAKGEPTGFVPFYLRKQLGMDKQKRLSGEVLRTLEAIYDRTPFPSSDVVRGLYELHRLNKEAALTWFAARREADGITASTQKRVGRTLREKDRDLEDAFTGGPQPWDAAPPSDDLLAALANKQQKEKEEQETKVVSLSKREMAMLRSSQPSPNKFKGKKAAEKAEVHTSPSPGVTQIGNTRFEVEEEAGPTLQDRVRASWRFRAAERPGAAAGTQRLRLRKGQ